MQWKVLKPSAIRAGLQAIATAKVDRPKWHAQPVAKPNELGYVGGSWADADGAQKHGFEVRIRLPPREHPPPHVHVHKAGGMVIINLPDADQPMAVRKIHDMRYADVLKALHLVEGHAEHLIAVWRVFHGLS